MKVQNVSLFKLNNNQAPQKREQATTLTMKKPLDRDCVSFGASVNAEAIAKTLETSTRINGIMTKIGKQWKDPEKAVRHLTDEINEVKEAIRNNDHFNLREELGDQLSIATGIADNYGLDIHAPISSAVDRGLIYGAEELDKSTAHVFNHLSGLAQSITKGDKAQAQKHFNGLVSLFVDQCHAFKVNPNEALAETNQKIKIRIDLMNKAAQRAGKTVEELPKEQTDKLWEEVKPESKKAMAQILEKKRVIA